MITSYDILQALVRTEKSTGQEAQNKYVFRVSDNATKIDIRRAVEDIYKVNVTDVNTHTVVGKLKRVRFKTGYSRSWKKALVTLKAGQKIDSTT